MRWTPLLALAGLLCGACNTPQLSPTTNPTPVMSISLGDLNEWIRFRLVYGLQADVDWVVGVARDSTAITSLGAPLLPTEAQVVLDAQANAESLVASARRYGDEHQAEFVGVWIEGPIVVLGFSDHVAERSAEVASLFGSKVTVRQVRYTRFQLQDFVNLIEEARGPNSDLCDGLATDALNQPTHCRDGHDWFESIGIAVEQVRVDEMANVVEIRYRAVSQAVESLVRDRFLAADWLRLHWMGPLPWAGSYGDMRVVVVNSRGAPVPFVLSTEPLDPRVWRGFGPDDVSDGTYLNRGVEAIEWEVSITYEDGGAQMTVTRTLAVPPEGVGTLELVVK